MRKFQEIFFLLCVFAAAISFRVWMTRLVPQPFLYDQTEYEAYARKIYNAPFMLASHSFRTYPAPFLFAVTYKFTGLGSHGAVSNVLIIIDSITSVIVFWVIKKTTGNQIAGLIASVLYAFNPFTSGNVGVVTSEVLTTFFIAASLFTGIIFIKKPAIGTGILLGLCIGLACQTRPAMTIGSLVILLTVFFWVKWKSQKLALVGIVLGGLLTVIYPLYTNWRDYHEFTPFKVDSFYAMEFYNGATLKILPPFARSEDYPPQQQIMWNEYWSEDHPGRTTADRSAMAAKYTALAWNVIRADPAGYTRWRFYKMWYVWQKENIYPYNEPGYLDHRAFTFWGNSILLGLAALGAVAGYFAKKNTYTTWLWITLIGVLATQTIAFSFSHAESRLTIPLYPILMIFAGLGITKWKHKIRNSSI